MPWLKPKMCTITIAGHHLQTEGGRPRKAISVDEKLVSYIQSECEQCKCDWATKRKENIEKMACSLQFLNLHQYVGRAYIRIIQSFKFKIRLISITNSVCLSLITSFLFSDQRFSVYGLTGGKARHQQIVPRQLEKLVNQVQRHHDLVSLPPSDTLA